MLDDRTQSSLLLTEYAYRDQALPGLRLAKCSRVARVTGRVLIGGLAFAFGAMLLAPWIQTVSGSGRVVAFDPQDRQQAVQAPIKGQIKRWAEGIRENATVEEGQFILELADIDDQLLDRLQLQLDLAQRGVELAKSAEQAAVRSVESSEGVVTANESELRAYEAALADTLAALDREIEAAQEKAKGKAEAVRAAQAKLEQAKLDYERKYQLLQEGLTSGLKFQEAEQKYRSATADLAAYRAELSAAEFEVQAKRSARPAKAQQEQGKIEKIRATLEDYRAKLAKAEAEREKARAEVQKAESYLIDTQSKLAKQGTQTITAPRGGTITSLIADGGSKLVKEGETLFVIVPRDAPRAVELYLDGNDAPLVTPGRHVRLQFEGWPAVQFAGWPSVAVGTFGGTVASVDDVDDGAGRFRCLVVPDPEEAADPEIAGAEGLDPETGWPDERYLRQGVRANGWVLLNEVSLGYEMWRRMNGFPPVLTDAPGKGGKSGDKGAPPAGEDEGREVGSTRAAGGVCRSGGPRGRGAAGTPVTLAGPPPAPSPPPPAPADGRGVTTSPRPANKPRHGAATVRERLSRRATAQRRSLTVAAPRPRRARFAAGLALFAAGCGGGRLVSTHGAEDALPVSARPTIPAFAAAAPGGAEKSLYGLEETPGDVRTAAYSPQEFGFGEEGGGLDGGLDGNTEGSQFDTLNEGGGLSPLDPSAAPSAGPLSTGVGDAPSAGPLQTETGDAPSAGPLDLGGDGGDFGADRGDLGSAPGDNRLPGLSPLPDADRSDAEGESGGGLGGGFAPGPRGLRGRGGAGGGSDPADLARPGDGPGDGDGDDGGDGDDAGDGGPVLTLADVTASVLATYPQLAEIAAGRGVADGQILEAKGLFDTKLKAAQEVAAVGFYENIRHSVGVDQPLAGGGELFAGYRIGRGEFEPWYQERVTNEGGEFKAGFTQPLLRNRRIDARRAAVAIANLERAAADPQVAAVQLAAVRAGSAAYWEWVAAGRLKAVADRLLDLTLDRTEALRRQVELEEKAEIELVQNDQSIASRRSKAIDADRKFRQAAAKLSIFLRTPAGDPLVPADELLPDRFPKTDAAVPPVESLIAEAVARRPELVDLDLQRKQAGVALAEARNDFLPDLDVGLVASQDVGELSSSRGDKQPFELDTAVVFSVPLQRRKAAGKTRQLEFKLAQLAAKRRFAADKAAVEVRVAVAALEAALEQTEQAEIAVDLAERLRSAELTAFRLGESDLLRLNIFESQAAAAAEGLVAARFAYRLAAADLAAATAASPAAPNGLVVPPPAPAPVEPVPAPMPLPVEPAPMPLPVEPAPMPAAL